MSVYALAALLAGCRCGAPAVELPPAPEHAAGWEALVAAAERGDVATTAVLARDLTLAPVPEDHPAAETLGGALGFLQVATDPEDLPDAVDRARQACVACHRDRGVEVEVP